MRRPIFCRRSRAREARLRWAPPCSRCRPSTSTCRYRPHIIGSNADTAAVAIQARLRRRSSGEIIDLFITDFVRFRDGRLVELREFVDHLEGVEQLLARKSSAAS